MFITPSFKKSLVVKQFQGITLIRRANLFAQVTWNAMVTRWVTYWDGLFTVFLCCNSLC